MMGRKRWNSIRLLTRSFDAPGRDGWFERGYFDAEDEWHDTPPRIARSLERALGRDEVEDSTARVVVVRQGASSRALGEGELTLEDGTVRSVVGRIEADVPAGYHELRLDGSKQSVRVIVSPGICVPPSRERMFGFAVQLYGLRSKKSWGMGDLGDLRHFARFSSRKLGAGAVLVNPLNAVAPALPQQQSPYFPTSRFYDSLLYLRIETVPGAKALGAALDRIARLGRLANRDSLVDRDRIFTLKVDALDRIFKKFPGSRRFDQFLQREGDLLVGFATFCALAERYGESFRKWPGAYKDSGSTAVSRFRKEHATRIRFHEWLQWNVDEQLARAGQETALVRDLPIGVDPDGADVWLFPNVFAENVSIGAPPDPINSLGQNWGLSPFIPWRLRASGYEPFIRTLRAAFRHVGALRIDHVMGLFRLFLIPHGLDPKDGGYVRFPARDLLDIVALESHRAGAFVIGEDLGTVAPEHRRELRHRGVLSYRLVWFEKRPPSKYPKASLAAVTTHDLPTIAGILSGADRRIRKELGLPIDDEADAIMVRRLRALSGTKEGAPIEDVILRVYDALARAPSVVVMAAIEDAIASADRPNMPGIAGPPSFRRALPLFIEELERHPLLLRVAALLRRKVRAGRVRKRPRRGSRVHRR